MSERDGDWDRVDVPHRLGYFDYRESNQLADVAVVDEMIEDQERERLSILSIDRRVGEVVDDAQAYRVRVGRLRTVYES